MDARIIIPAVIGLGCFVAGSRLHNVVHLWEQRALGFARGEVIVLRAEVERLRAEARGCEEVAADVGTKGLFCLHHEQPAPRAVYRREQQSATAGSAAQNRGLEGFTSKYNVTQLVYYECFENVRNAIHREKEIKGKSSAIRAIFYA